jgi:protein TonB
MMLAILSTAYLLVFAAPALAQDDTAQVYKPGNGVTAPKLIKEVKPSYPPDAMRRGVRGSVKLECVVRPDGTVVDVRVVQSLDPDLDAASMRALKEWTFSPGLKDGKAVPVLLEVEMSYSLGGTKPRRKF